MSYILSEKPSECIFCENPKKGDDRANLILYRAKNTFVVMNLYPYNNGHVMVVPFIHRSSFDGLPDAVVCEMMQTSRYSVDCIGKAFRPEGFNIGLNIGRVAGAGIEEHLHIHIVPRWAGDMSFMTILDEVRVIPEHLSDTYDKLYPVFNRK
jgi:ATP adenylyltransferase